MMSSSGTDMDTQTSSLDEESTISYLEKMVDGYMLQPDDRTSNVEIEVLEDRMVRRYHPKNLRGKILRYKYADSPLFYDIPAKLEIKTYMVSP